MNGTIHDKMNKKKKAVLCGKKLTTFAKTSIKR